MTLALPLPRDARWFQIAFLACFLLAGMFFLGFDFPPWQPALILGSACATQWALVKLLRIPNPGYLSAVISSLGLSLLLRTDLPWMPAVAAFIAISSKFLIRFRGKHVFNPTLFGLTMAMLLTPHAWCSPSQWGESSAVIAWFAIFGLAVVNRAFRMDISLAFIAAWVLLKAGRVFYLGQSIRVLAHQLAVGSLILFTFFMISDPKTTPDRRVGRLLFAACVAVLAFFLQHQLWWQNTLIWSLLLLSPLSPLLDHLLPAPRYAWGQEGTAPCAPQPLPSASHS